MDPIRRLTPIAEDHMKRNDMERVEAGPEAEPAAAQEMVKEEQTQAPAADSAQKGALTPE